MKFNNEELKCILAACESLLDTYKFLKGFSQTKSNNEIFLEKIIKKIKCQNIGKVKNLKITKCKI